MTLSSCRDMNHGRRIAELSVSAWACLLHASFPTPTLLPPAPKVMLVTGHDEIKEARGLVFRQDGGRQVQNSRTGGCPELLNGTEMMTWKQGGARAILITVTLRVRPQHSDSLLSTSFMILAVPFSGICLAHTPQSFQRLTGRVVEGVHRGILGEKLSLLTTEPVDSLYSIFSSAHLRYRILSLSWEYPAMLFSLICLFILCSLYTL